MLLSDQNKIAIGSLGYLIVIQSISLIIISFGLNILVVYFRFDHFGRVCSGDFKYYTNMKGYD